MLDPPNMRGVKKPRFQGMQGKQESHHSEPQGRHIKWTEDGSIVEVTGARFGANDERPEHVKRKREEGGESSGHGHPGKKQKNRTRDQALGERSDQAGGTSMMRIKGAAKLIEYEAEADEIESSADEIDLLAHIDKEKKGKNSNISSAKTTGSFVGSAMRRAVSGLLASIAPANSTSTEPPAADATPAVAEEEVATLRAECSDLQRQVKELKEAEAALQAQLATAQQEVVMVPVRDDIAQAIGRVHSSESALAQVKRDLDCARTRERQLEQHIRQVEVEYRRVYDAWTALDTENVALRESLAKTQERVNVVVQQKGFAAKEVKRLRNQLDAHAQKALDAVPLDAFSNTLDQISEAQVLSSLEGLNEAVSDFLSNLTEEAVKRVNGPSEEERHELQFHEDERRLWEALQTPGLNDEHQGLLLEALLRTIIIGAIHPLFFANVVLSVATAEAKLMDDLYAAMKASESWTVAQRWKAFTAASFARGHDASSWKPQEQDLSVRIVRIVQHVYRMPTAAAISLHEWVHGQLPGIFSQAHTLSLQTKHDILSVDMRVVRSGDSRFSFAQCVPGWDGMDTQDGDEVLAQFSLGLVKVSETGTATISLKPAVVTTSLLRCVGVAGG